MSNFLKIQFSKIRVDLVFLIFLFILILYGQWILFSSSSIMAYHKKSDIFYYSNKQIVWHFIGLGLMFLFIFFPIRIYKKYYKFFIYITILFLFLVFFPGIGKSVQYKDSFDFNRWIQFGWISFQPSEFAKIGYLIYISYLLQNHPFSLKEQIRNYIPVLLIFLSLFLQPQYGILILFFLVWIFLLLLKGFSIFRLIAFSLVSIPFFVFITLFQPYRWERIQVWLDPYFFRFDKGYQLVMSFRAFSEGGLMGTNIAKSIAHRYLTYGHTDFIFSLLAESSGIIGTTFLISLYTFIYIRGFLLLKRIDEEFNFFLASGILFFFILQTIINLSVTTGLIPTTGIGLPFVSYGGSSLISYYILMGIFLNLTKKKDFRNES
ncbi:MAG: FtsW/RodA/SpoVE family cell cycle protein [Leptonema sp. (in: bacteria)]